MRTEYSPWDGGSMDEKWQLNANMAAAAVVIVIMVVVVVEEW